MDILMKRYGYMLAISATMTHPTVLHAEGEDIFNDLCQSEVGIFQAASNAADVEVSRHALLLCLADSAYFDDNQVRSDHQNWPDASHFRIFASKPEIDISNSFELLQSHAEEKNQGLPHSGNAFFAASPSSCTCPNQPVTRSPADPNGPLKAESFDLFLTLNVGNVLAGDLPELERVESMIDHIRTQRVVPFSSDSQAADVIAKFSNIDTTGWENLANWSTANGGLSAGLGQGILKGNNPFETVAWNQKSASTSVVAQSGSCWCNQVNIPIKRSGGDGVPSNKYEFPTVFFQTNNLGALSETLLNNGIARETLTLQGDN